MSTTPEGKVKDRVKRILKATAGVYYHCPVQNGMGMPSLDFIGCCHGLYIGIETKAPGKKPTGRQRGTMSQIEAAGGKVFVIDGAEESYAELADWLVDAALRMELGAGADRS